MSIPVPAPPLIIAITPYGNANRPKLAMPSPSYITVHEVGNTSPGANEEMHRAFVHNGGGPSQVSFHFVVGPDKAIQLLPLDEAAWHASDGYNGTGNRDSIAIETIQIGDFDKTLWHLAWLINEIATNPNRFFHNADREWDMSINRIVQHNHWAPDKKNCPQFIRDRGLWDTLMKRVDLWHADTRPEFPGGLPIELPEEKPKYAKPDKPDWLTTEPGVSIQKIKTTPVYPLTLTYTAVRETPRRKAAPPNDEVIGPPLRKGQRFRADWVFRSRDKTWVLSKNGSRFNAADLTPIVNVSVDGHISTQF